MPFFYGENGYHFICYHHKIQAILRFETSPALIP
jgi:hypothetical protein